MASDRCQYNKSPMNVNQPHIIIPNEVEAWISGVSRVEIAADETVSLIYDDQSRASARLGLLSHAVESNFLALVRCVQNASRASGQKLAHARLA